MQDSMIAVLGHFEKYAPFYTAIGALITIAAFVYTIYLVRKTKNAAEAASEATDRSIRETRRILGIYDVLVEAPICIGYLREVVDYIRDGELRAALNRANDCKHKLNAMMENEYFKNNLEDRKQVSEQLRILGTVIINIHEDLQLRSQKIKIKSVAAMSDNIQGVLSRCIGKAKSKA